MWDSDSEDEDSVELAPDNLEWMADLNNGVILCTPLARHKAAPPGPGEGAVRRPHGVPALQPRTQGRGERRGRGRERWGRARGDRGLRDPIHGLGRLP